MNILVAIDSFKGTLSSVDLSNLIFEHFTPQGHTVKMIPISDGGEGFIDSIQTFLGCDKKTLTSYGPLMDHLDVNYIMDKETAYIELHTTSGLTRIEKKRLNPMKTTTFGLGVLIKHVILEGAKRVIIGLGGSATNDGGAGMLQALGVDFYTEDALITEPMNGELIGSVHHFDTQKCDELIRGVTFEIASDVTNPLLGLTGSTHVFSKQKGATLEQMKTLEKHMSHYAYTIESSLKHKFQDIPGSGAAGGVGFACLSILHAHLHSGIGFMIDLLHIETYIKESDVVIVGEGRLDDQTLFGKAPFGIALMAKKHNKKVIGLFGSRTSGDVSMIIDQVYTVVPKHATEEASLLDPVKYFCLMLNDIIL